MFPVRLSMLVEIRESIELGIAIGVILVHYVNLHFAKASSEHNLAAGWQLLRREEKNLITQKGLVDGAKKLVRNVIGQFHAGNFGTEFRRQRTHVERPMHVHGWVHRLTTHNSPCYGQI